MILNSKLKNLAIIPARAGSKGLPGKNTKLLKSKPMIAYSIEAAIQSGCFDQVIVSTDDLKIADIAKQYGAEIPFLRPSLLANDAATMIDVVLHALQFFENQQVFFDSVTILQPTSPLRAATDIQNAMKLFIKNKAESVISVCEVFHSPLWMNTLPEDNNLKNFLHPNILNKRRQDLPTYYMLNGAIYLTKISSFKKNKSFFSDRSFAYIMPKERSVDIDNLTDFYYCETLLKNELV